MRSFELVRTQSKSSACAGYEELRFPVGPTPLGIFFSDVGVTASNFKIDFDLVDSILVPGFGT